MLGGVLKKTIKSVFTVCSVNYLHKAITLLQSVEEVSENDVEMYIFIADRKRDIVGIPNYISIVWVVDIEFPDYLKCAFKYNVIEFNTCVKPFVALHLLKKYRKVVYLDPDTFLFSSINMIFDELGDSNMLLTPHSLTSYHGQGRPNDLDIMRFGVFNLGFFAINKSPETEMILTWWHNKLLNQCFYEPALGYGVDQKWIDFVPVLFDGIKICRHAGFNVAFWNLHERGLSLNKSEHWVVNENIKLVFAHFSSFDFSNPKVVASKQTRYAWGDKQDFLKLSEIYRKKLAFNIGHIKLNTTMEYGYSCFDDGKVISDLLRRRYFSDIDKFSDDNPFEVNCGVYFYAKNNKLFGTKNTKLITTFKDESTFKRNKKLLNILYKISERLLGPDKYFLLLRYLSSNSSSLSKHND